MAHFSAQHVREQAERLLREVIRPAIHRDVEPLTLTAWEADGEPVPVAEAVAQSFRPIETGSPWGKPWGTTWFHVTGEVPERFGGVEHCTVEMVVDLGFNDMQAGFQCEALAYTPDGKALKAIENYNRYVRLPNSGAGASVEIFLEAASNPDVVNEWSYEPTWEGSPSTMGTDPIYTLGEIVLALRDERVASLQIELEVLLGLAREIGDQTTRGIQIMAAVSRALHALESRDVPGTVDAARNELQEVLTRPASAGAHRIAAVGHAHIDSAWLWPIRETARKVARTFSNVVDLAEQDPEFVFAASSAQQYAWLKEFHPDVFERVRETIERGQFVPVGGQWVEADNNLPGGEASARQFVQGTKFFRREFDWQPREVWLPDSFGYSGAMPQIARLAGARWFLTQKLSWNEVNRMPHHTFWWEGIDGSRVFTHFPPTDNYNSELGAEDIHRADRQYAEKSWSNVSLVPFGYGDGGGGPTREMTKKARCMRDLEGSPKVEMTGPRDFFQMAEEDVAAAPTWSGEMYLEFHRGVFTSQAQGKRGNRRSEALLFEAELWATTASVRAGYEYPYEALERIWQLVLLYQFHDILPGTCIAWVHEEVVAAYASIEEELQEIIDSAIALLAGEGDLELESGSPVFGALSAAVQSDASVTASRMEGGVLLESAHARVVIDTDGRISSAVDLATGRDAITASGVGNKLELFRDRPTTWDAWNLDHDYEAVGESVKAESIEIMDGAVKVVLSTGASTITQVISLATDRAAVGIETEVDWHDQERILKLGFDLDVLAETSSSEVQFGHVNRPVHRNTTWDAARYEIPVHRWIHLGEAGQGVALANHVTYGHDVAALVEGERRTGTQLRASLLRGPRYPDPEADQGRHVFSHVLRLGATIGDAVDEGYRLHVPPRALRGAQEVEPLVSVESDQVRIEAVKLAEDGTGDLVVRLYESLGGVARTRLLTDAMFTSAVVTDLHEDTLDALDVQVDERTSVELVLRPFQIMTLRFSRG